MIEGLTRCTPRSTVSRGVQPSSSEERLTARTPVWVQVRPSVQEKISVSLSAD